MINFNYKVKQTKGFGYVTASVAIDETQLSPEDLTLVMQENKPENRFSKGGVNLSVAKIYRAYGTPSVMSSEFVADQYLSAEQALEIFKAYFIEKTRLEADLPALIAEFQAEREAKSAADAETKRLAEEQKAEDHARSLQEAAQIHWNENGKAILNLYRQLATLSELEMDSRFTNWVKRVNAVDAGKENGYCFVGDWIHDKTVEIENNNAVYLVAGTSGSRKYATTHYRVVILKDGKLQATDIRTDNRDAGWALLIRDQIAQLLNQ